MIERNPGFRFKSHIFIIKFDKGTTSLGYIFVSLFQIFDGFRNIHIRIMEKHDNLPK